MRASTGSDGNAPVYRAGLTCIGRLRKDGYPIIAKIEMLLSADTPAGITKSMGVELIDLLIICCTPAGSGHLKDRYEMLMVASAALIARIPIAHIHGGEITEGAKR